MFFNPFLRKFVLVFFDDILIYIPSKESHVVHLQTIFETMRSHSLLAKRSKCVLGAIEVEYLGHFISGIKVATDSRKISVMNNWSVPASVKELRGFLCLARYHRKFIKLYDLICKPLTDLLKKEGFAWSPTAKQAFEQLKKALCSAPALAFPDFAKTFEVETDASVWYRSHPCTRKPSHSIYKQDVGVKTTEPLFV